MQVICYGYVTCYDEKLQNLDQCSALIFEHVGSWTGHTLCDTAKFSRRGGGGGTHDDLEYFVSMPLIKQFHETKLELL